MKLKRCNSCGRRFDGVACKRSHVIAEPMVTGIEVWIPIPGTCGYEVSDFGRVRNPEGHILRPALRMGYPTVSVSNGHGGRVVPVHRLVLLAFVGPPAEGRQAAHLDGNGQNNRPLNLAWVTAKENNNHKILHGTLPRGEQCNATRLTAELVREIRKLHSEGYAALVLAERYGVGSTTVDHIVHRRTWRHVS